MGSSNYYDVTSLPALGELGSPPPLTALQLLEHLADNPVARMLVEALLLQDDLLQREAFLAGESQQVRPSVLTEKQARNEEPLPAYLAGGGEEAGPSNKTDDLWQRYFRYVADIAHHSGSRSLAAWVAYEVTLRNTLACERAKLLGLQPNDYLVAKDLAGTDEDFADVIDDWSSASTPLEALRIVIRQRWEWIRQHDAWFTFKNDELAAYAVRLMLLHQWHRSSQAAADRSAASTADESSKTVERTTA